MRGELVREAFRVKLLGRSVVNIKAARSGRVAPQRRAVPRLYRPKLHAIFQRVVSPSCEYVLIYSWMLQNVLIHGEKREIPAADRSEGVLGSKITSSISTTLPIFGADILDKSAI